MSHAIRLLLRRHGIPVGGFALLGIALAALFTFTQPLRYGATARLLIIQRATYGLDPYTALTSAERVAGNLSELLSTTDLFTKVSAQDPQVSWNDFGDTDAARRKAWEGAIRAEVAAGSGLLSVTALHTEKEQAGRIAQAVADVLTSRGKEYVGGDVEIKLVDAPLVSKRPVDPNIPLLLGLGGVLGAAVGVGYVLLGGRRG